MSIFARRHYQAIAEVFKAFNIDMNEAPSEIELTARALASMFLHDNSNFNRERFLKACGMEGE